jgi:polar amino acid transport system substrate-binding protein
MQARGSLRMTTPPSDLGTTKRPFHFKLFPYRLLGVLLGLSILFLVRGCSFPAPSTPTLLIGLDQQWFEPYLMGKEHSFIGFNRDLLTAIAQQQSLPFTLIMIPPNHNLHDLQIGKFKGVLTNLMPSTLNQNEFLFSDPYFLLGPVLIIPKTAPLEGWNEKAKKIIGIPREFPQILHVIQDPTIQIKFYDYLLSALTDLSERKIDGVLFPTIAAHIYVRTFYPNELKVATLPLDDEGVRLVTLKNQEGEELIKRFNQGLAALKQSSEYNELLEHWGFTNVEKIDN